MTPQDTAWLTIPNIKCIGPARWKKVFSVCDDDPERALNANRAVLLSCMPSDTADKLIEERESADISRLVQDMEVSDIQFVHIQDERYPKLLKEIHDPPLVLFYRGTLPAPDALLISIVGTRKITYYGRAVTEQIVSALAPLKIGIVSGLAIGIDAFAHEQALNKNCFTLAVVPGGLDDAHLVPPRHTGLAHRIIENGGCVMSEFPPGSETFKTSYPVRNRLIAGISKATIVVEAAIASGSLITARSALSENREVFAVPGPITSPVSEGPNMLLKEGAIPLTKTNDILETLGLVAPISFTQDRSDLTETEKTLFAILSATPMLADDIARSLNLSSSDVSSTLTLLELKAAARHVGSGYFVRA